LSTPETLCDYEGSRYRTEFWGEGREYEDLVERIALRKLLPAAGERLAELGAGFGRLADLYSGYRQVILLDPARSMLQEAQERHGSARHILYVRGDVNNLPLAGAACDALVMVRVMHHLSDVPRALAEIGRSLAGQGTLVAEYANKRNLKSIGRYLLRRQSWSPFALAPVEFAPLHFDFHPVWMAERLRESGLVTQQALAVSTFRLALLKRLIPARVLAGVDGLLQRSMGAWCKLSPSVFVRAAPREAAYQPLPEHPFRCPACHCQRLAENTEGLVCSTCRRHWPIIDGIYDFGEH
jgi:SAM-dependent methyltransferase